ncbi:MAG: hypothetical protein ACPGWR_31525 [Ardenticatenaceae bacterium]
MDYLFLLHLHSGWRYIVLLMLLVSTVLLLVGWLTGGKWNKLVNGFSMFTPIVIDIQLLLGLVLWFGRPNVMGDSRFGGNILEHVMTMLIAVVLGHVAAVRIKRAVDDGTKFQNGAIYFVLTGLVVSFAVARVTGVL